MDDFLHNLRSGKLKQDRSSRSYNDPNYKGSPRRNVMDRRKRDNDVKESFERLNAIKEVLETLGETQKRIAEAYEARTNAELRKARAMEVLAKNLYRMLNPDATDVDELFDQPEPVKQALATGDADETGTDEAETESSADDALGDDVDQFETEDEFDTSSADDSKARKLTDEQRRKVFDVTKRMRQTGDSWENIARHIGGKGFPTVSGKGTWRGVMVKNLYEKMASGNR